MTEHDASILGSLEERTLNTPRPQRDDELLCDTCSSADGRISPTHYIPSHVAADPVLKDAFCAGVIAALEEQG